MVMSCFSHFRALVLPREVGHLLSNQIIFFLAFGSLFPHINLPGSRYDRMVDELGDGFDLSRLGNGERNSAQPKVLQGRVSVSE
jgi:hypothetical protein